MLSPKGKEVALQLRSPFTWSQKMAQKECIESINIVFTIFSVSFFSTCLLLFDLMDSHHLGFLTLVHFDLSFGDLNLFDLLDNRWGLDSSLIFSRWLVSILAYDLLKLLHKLWVLLEHLSKLQPYSSVGWDVWSLIFESTMHIDARVTDPDLMSSSRLGLELFPF
jgi:hypothetical protein